MIKKKRQTSLTILKLEALLRRLPSNHPQRKNIEESLKKYYAGFRGEEAIDYYLNDLDEEPYFIFQDIRLPCKDGTFFQLDFLILTTFFILIIEVKNITGILYFDREFHQLIRITSEKEEAFHDPIIQVRKHVYQLYRWLENNKFPAVPISSIIAISHPTTIIKATPNHKEISNLVIHAAKIPEKFISFKNRFKHAVLTNKDMKKLSRYLMKEHVELDPDILTRFQISPSEIIRGVLCSNCHGVLLEKKRERWCCPKCNISKKNAHLEALLDYRLIIGDTITNKQCRAFLCISSISIVAKMLSSLNLKSTGSYKDRVYKLDVEVLRELVDGYGK